MPGIGMTLRSARIQRGLTIEQVAQDTRISARFLEALEDEAFDELPAPVYVRGFLRSYSNYLRLDPMPLLTQLPDEMGGGEAGVVASPEPIGDEPARRAADPFRPAPPSRPMIIGDDPPLQATPLQASDAFSPRRAETETPLNGGYGIEDRRGRVGGVLVERGGVYEDNGRIVRFAAILGGAFVVVLLLVVGTMAFGGDGGGRQNTLAGDVDDTPTARATTNPIVVGSPTTDPSATVSETPTPGDEGEDEETPTPTEESTATPTEEAEEPTSTPTAPPPTATPTVSIPTATPTTAVLPGHGSFFSECPKDGNDQPVCGSPMTVVCPPDGPWFVDYGNDFPLDESGYRWAIANTNGEAITLGDSGCL